MPAETKRAVDPPSPLHSVISHNSLELWILCRIDAHGEPRVVAVWHARCVSLFAQVGSNACREVVVSLKEESPMLVLSRKLGQRFQVGQDVRITIVKID